MPHATSDESRANSPINENADIQRFLGGYDSLAQDDNSWAPLDPGEKVDDAQDYEDISDEDLPEEEEATNHLDEDDDGQVFVGDSQVVKVENEGGDEVMGGLFGDGEEDNDLFGENGSSSPVLERRAEVVPQQQARINGFGLALPSKSGSGLALPKAGAERASHHMQQFHASPTSLSPQSFTRDDPMSPSASSHAEPEEEEEELDEMARLQRDMFRAAALHEDLELPPDRPLAEMWPKFPAWEADEVPKWTELFAPLPGMYKGKVPLKPPKPVVATKISLDLLPDQEKSFRTATVVGKPTASAHAGRGLVKCEKPVNEDESGDDIALSEFDETEVIGNITMQDLAVLCQDWDIPSGDDGSVLDADEQADLMEGDWENEEKARPQKRRRVGILDHDATLAMQDAYLRFEDPEEATARVARAVTLDMNDPLLLLDEQVPQPKAITKRVSGDGHLDSALGRDLARRYNISNDEAYDLLKENHQHKVRGTLGHTTLEHSMPAIKLQWPFYRVGMEAKEKRAFHRQPLHMYDAHNRSYRFQKPGFQKRKNLRGKETKELFSRTEDLTLNDNSSVLLLEYSEEVPVILSKFGMGNRVTNYYRKRDAEDSERPKREIGETQVLANQDKSPFFNFGHVDPGETVPSIQNPLFRAPIFKHSARSTDFLLGISHSYEKGTKFSLRNIENLHVVGQQYPLAEIPGEHSRKVTDAAKKRLKAISFRMYQKSLDPRRRGVQVTNYSLLNHLPGARDLPGLRSKMREFMKYEKKPKQSDDVGYWVPMPGFPAPDLETIRGWIKPEDICLLDSMQVGVQHLADLGIEDKRNDKEDEDAEEDENIEKMLAPWRTTKNFLNATSGKAMLKVHGEGDPTGRGEAFSMLKTNMKGGYVPRGESATDKMANMRVQQSTGHKYNVAMQQAKYDRDIRDTWEKQKAGLSNEANTSDVDMEDVDDTQSVRQSSVVASQFGGRGTPRQSVGVGGGAGSVVFDDSASQFTKHSFEHSSDQVLLIKRRHRDAMGNWVDTPVRVDNPKVIKAYKKRLNEKRLENTHLEQIAPTGDPELDRLQREKIMDELRRLERNKDRREARENLKKRQSGGSILAGSPAGEADDAEAGSPSAVGTGKAKGPGKGRSKDGTARKCANCGMVGHIKTNRKLVLSKFSCRCVIPNFGQASVAPAASTALQPGQQKPMRLAALLATSRQPAHPIGEVKAKVAGALAIGQLRLLCPLLNGSADPNEAYANGAAGAGGMGGGGANGEGSSFGATPGGLKL
nr:hypothetical protein B0A51_05498 [Rachicladosporium sp. CCFEE 5018]